MLKYIVIIFLCLLLFVQFYPSDNGELESELKVGELYLLNLDSATSRSFILKRLSDKQVLFSFLEDGAQAEVDSNSEESYVLGQDIFISNGTCKINFHKVGRAPAGNLSCKNGLFGTFQGQLQISTMDTLPRSEINTSVTGDLLAKLEDLSDKMLQRTSDILVVENVLSMLRSNLSLNFKLDDENSVINKPPVSRESLLRSSVLGQEIFIASRLLDEESKLVLSDSSSPVQKDKEIPAAPTPLVAESPKAKVTTEWWKGID